MANRRGLVDRICNFNQALSDPQRVKMMKIMGSSPLNTVSVSEFARLLGISQPASTKHLKILYDVDLVARRRIGNTVYYTPNIKVIDEYHNLLELAFVKGFLPCKYNYQCETCPEMETCA